MPTRRANKAKFVVLTGEASLVSEAGTGDDRISCLSADASNGEISAVSEASKTDKNDKTGKTSTTNKTGKTGKTRRKTARLAEAEGRTELSQNQQMGRIIEPLSYEASSNDVPVLRRAAMDFLARREHSIFELRAKLTPKFPEVEAELLERVLLQLQDDNLQSDQRFAECYVRYRKSRGFGSEHIRADLYTRKVAPSIIEEYIHEADADWLEIARRLVTKKLGMAETVEFGSKLHRKTVRFLASRGFTPTVSRRALEGRVGPRNAVKEYGK